MATPTSLKTKALPIEPGTHVRSLNSVYRPLGVGRVQKVRDHQCKVEYDSGAMARSE